MRKGVTLAQAILAAVRLHQDQVDKAGEPYVLHVLRVMLAGRTEKERVLGALHDTAEDAGWDRVRAELGELPPWLEQGLDAISRRKGESYLDFIGRVDRNELAKRVKLADLADNMDLTRIPNPTDEDRRRVREYRCAAQILASSGRVRWFVWEGPPDHVVKVVDGSAWILRDGGEWEESAYAWRRVMGIGGDADSREVSEGEARAFMARR